MSYKLKTIALIVILFSSFSIYSFDLPDDAFKDILPGNKRWWFFAPLIVPELASQAATETVIVVRAAPGKIHEIACEHPKTTAAVVGITVTAALAALGEKGRLKTEGATSFSRLALISVPARQPLACFGGAMAGGLAGVWAKSGELNYLVKKLRAGVQQTGDAVNHLGHTLDAAGRVFDCVERGAEGVVTAVADNQAQAVDLHSRTGVEFDAIDTAANRLKTTTSSLVGQTESVSSGINAARLAAARNSTALKGLTVGSDAYNLALRQQLARMSENVAVIDAVNQESNAVRADTLALLAELSSKTDSSKSGSSGGTR
jgi:hypothetical protein